MVMEMMKNWEVAVDGIQIFLCLLIIFFLIRNHRHRLKPDSTNPQQVSGQDFNLQVFSQTIRQQIEMAFAHIQNVVANECHNLEKVLQLQQVKHLSPRPSDISVASPSTDSGGAFEKLNESADQSKLQTRIRKMTGRGMSPKQIADELKTPLGEIELILSLQKRD
jgi:hypothetical protein